MAIRPPKDRVPVRRRSAGWDASCLRRASPYWIRHSHACHALARGAELTSLRDPASCVDCDNVDVSAQWRDSARAADEPRVCRTQIAEVWRVRERRSGRREATWLAQVVLLTSFLTEKRSRGNRSAQHPRGWERRVRDPWSRRGHWRVGTSAGDAWSAGHRQGARSAVVRRSLGRGRGSDRATWSGRPWRSSPPIGRWTTQRPILVAPHSKHREAPSTTEPSVWSMQTILLALLSGPCVRQHGVVLKARGHRPEMKACRSFWSGPF